MLSQLFLWPILPNTGSSVITSAVAHKIVA
jgi:hypothetical protein